MQLSIFDFSNEKKKRIEHEGYPPSHPWYYRLGGKILSVDEILPTDTGYSKREDGTLENIISEIKEDIKIYEEVAMFKNETLSDYEKSLGYDWTSSIHLKYNHIAYRKGKLQAAGMNYKTL